uniref:Uncharacterized protein n=1 Tax=Cacopsylla melanoneura TaxID=428564 RepID=A0A8D9B9Q1_9HEMI
MSLSILCVIFPNKLCTSLVCDMSSELVLNSTNDNFETRRKCRLMGKTVGTYRQNLGGCVCVWFSKMIRLWREIETVTTIFMSWLKSSLMQDWGLGWFIWFNVRLNTLY